MEKLNKQLQEYLTVMTFNDSDVDKNFDRFHQTISDSLDEIAPERIIKLSAKQYLHEPWMYKGLLKCSKKQQKLYKTSLPLGMTVTMLSTLTIEIHTRS